MELAKMKEIIRADLDAAKKCLVELPDEELKTSWVQLLSDPEIKSLLNPAMLKLDQDTGNLLRDKLVKVFLSKVKTEDTLPEVEA